MRQVINLETYKYVLCCSAWFRHRDDIHGGILQVSVNSQN